MCRVSKNVAPITRISSTASSVTAYTMMAQPVSTRPPEGECESASGEDSLPAHLPVAIHNILVTGQLLQTARPARVKFVRADADLRPQPELVTVVEARAGVDHHRRRIDRRREA